MTVMSWAETHISAAHNPRGGRQIHGHTWRVRAWWKYDGTDVVMLRDALLEACEAFDHTLLPDSMTRAEDLAEHIGKRLKAARIDIWRDAERLGASWTP